MPAYKWWTNLVLDTFESVGVKDSHSSKIMAEVARDLYYYYATGKYFRKLTSTKK